MVLVQKLPCFEEFWLSNIGKENVFIDILERKNASLGYKNKKFQKAKNGHFSNSFFLGNVRQENVFYDILKGKNAFLGYKIQQVQKVQKLTFFQRG